MRLNQTVVQLNSYLHEELSAVEGYKKALGSVQSEPAHSILERCEKSHEERAEMLRRQITYLGGRPVDTSVPWHIDAPGEAGMIERLSQCEQVELGDYKRELVALDRDARGLVEKKIIPEVAKTAEEIEQLKEKMLH